MNSRTKLALSLASLMLTGCSMLPTEPEPPALELTPPVSTQRASAAIKKGKVTSRVKVNVAFGSAEQRPLYTRTSGRLRELHVTPGAQVAAGQLLAELESASLPYDLEQAALDLQKAQNALDRALARQGFTDGPSEADRDRLEHEVKVAALKHQRLSAQLADLRIVAPFDGYIVAIALSVGEQAEAYKEVLSVAEAGALVARATVDEATAAKLQTGMKAEIYPNDNNPAAVQAEVEFVPTLGTGRSSPVAIIRPVESPRLRRGQNGRADIIVAEKENVLLVPLSAVRDFGGRKFVTVVQGEVRQEVTVTLGLDDGEMAEVLSGLEEGDQVVAR